MQATLLLVLLCTFGLAALLQRSRQNELAVTLSEKPLLVGRLAFHYPRGWRVDQKAENLPVTATEPKVAGRHDSRIILLHQVLAGTSETAEQLLAAVFRGEAGRAGTARPFEMFGRSGVIVPFESYEQLDDYHVRRIPGWYAAVIAPKAAENGEHLGVILVVRGDATEAGAGERLLRQVAGGLSLRGR
jgi:hypothetical protein